MIVSHKSCKESWSVSQGENINASSTKVSFQQLASTTQYFYKQFRQKYPLCGPIKSYYINSGHKTEVLCNSMTLLLPWLVECGTDSLARVMSKKLIFTLSWLLTCYKENIISYLPSMSGFEHDVGRGFLLVRKLSTLNCWLLSCVHREAVSLSTPASITHYICTQLKCFLLRTKYSFFGKGKATPPLRPWF